MNLEIVLLESCLGISSIIILLILKHFQINTNYSKLLYCSANLGIFLLQVKLIGQMNYSLLGITFALIAAFYYKQPKQTTEIPKILETPQINVFKTQISFADKNNKVEAELELPKKLQVIQSIHESNSSLTPAPNTNDEAQKYNTNLNPEHRKVESGSSQQELKKPFSPLLPTNNADHKIGISPAVSPRNGNPPVVPRKSSVLQLQPNLNVIKFQDDLGEIKFGILKTLKSVSFDQVGHEVEGIMRADTDKQLTHLLSAVEQTTEPRMQILYESQQPEYQVNDKLRGAINFDSLGYAPEKQDKLITWKKIFKELICLFILSSNLSGLRSQQILFLGLLSIRIIMTYSKLQNDSLRIVFEMREVLIWIMLILTPLLGILLINIIDPQIAMEIQKFSQWIIIIITLRYSKIVQKYFEIFTLLMIVITAAITLC